MAEPGGKKKKVRKALTEEQRKSKRQTDRVRNRTKVNIGAAFSEWQELRQTEACKSDADLAFLLLHLYAASPQPVCSTASKYDVIVNIRCLLQLFQFCEVCRQKSEIKTLGDGTCLSVTQQCHSCNHLRTWASNLSASQPTHSENGEKSQNAQVAEVQVALPPEDPDEAQSSEDSDEAQSPEDADEALSSEDADEALLSDDADEAVEMTGSLSMAVTEDQPPRPGGSGPSLVRSKDGNKGASVRRKVPEVAINSETYIVTSHDHNYMVIDRETDNAKSQNEKGPSLQERSLLGGQQLEHFDMHLGCEEVMVDPEDSESQTSQVDTEGEKKHGAVGGCEGQYGVCQMEGKEKRETHGEVKRETQGEEKRETQGEEKRETQGGEKQQTQGEEKREMRGEEKRETQGEEKREMQGEEKRETQGEEEEESENDGESESEFDLEEEDGLTESETDFDPSEEEDGELDGSDSDFELEERSTRGREREGQMQNPTGLDGTKEYKYFRRYISLCPKCGVLYNPMQQYRKCDHKVMIQCPDCGKHCANDNGLKSHQKRVHKEGIVFPCKFCQKPFKTHLEKKTHQKSHRLKKGNKIFSCSECPQTFTNATVRNRHVREHKKHICQICDKEFKKPHQLDRHKLIHSDDKPHKCTVCQRAFAQNSQLKSHLRVHTGERPFQCQLCDNSFNHNVSLKNHVRRYHSPDSGADPDAGAEEHGEDMETDRETGKEEVGQKCPQQVQLTFWTEWETWAGREGDKVQQSKRKRWCSGDAKDEEERRERQQGSDSDPDKKMGEDSGIRGGRGKRGRGVGRGRGRGRGVGRGRGRGRGRGVGRGRGSAGSP